MMKHTQTRIRCQEYILLNYSHKDLFKSAAYIWAESKDKALEKYVEGEYLLHEGFEIADFRYKILSNNNGYVMYEVIQRVYYDPSEIHSETHNIMVVDSSYYQLILKDHYETHTI